MLGYNNRFSYKALRLYDKKRLESFSLRTRYPCRDGGKFGCYRTGTNRCRGNIMNLKFRVKCA